MIYHIDLKCGCNQGEILIPRHCSFKITLSKTVSRRQFSENDSGTEPEG